MPANSASPVDCEYAPGVCWPRATRRPGSSPKKKWKPPGRAAAIKLTPDRASIDADGEDLSIITVAVTDAAGRSCRWRTTTLISNSAARARSSAWATATRVVTNRMCMSPPAEPHGRFQGLALSNAAPATRSPERDCRRNSTIARMGQGGRAKPGRPVDARRESPSIGPRLTATPAMLAADPSPVNFGMIDDEGWVYVNGPQSWANPRIGRCSPHFPRGNSCMKASIPSPSRCRTTRPRRHQQGRLARNSATSPPLRLAAQRLQRPGPNHRPSRHAPGTVTSKAPSPGIEPATLNLTAGPAVLRPALP